MYKYHKEKVIPEQWQAGYIKNVQNFLINVLLILFFNPYESRASVKC